MPHEERERREQRLPAGKEEDEVARDEDA